MKNRVLSIFLALILVCVPQMSVCAAPNVVAAEEAAELCLETAPEQEIVKETTVCYTTEDGITVCETKPVEETATLSASPKQLPVPADLRWNEDWREWGNQNNGGKYNGYISWKPVANCEGDYKIYVYCNGQEVFYTNWGGLNDHNGDGRVGVEIAGHDVFNKSGKYTFKVIAKGDGQNYSDSNAAESKSYTYTLPSAKLATPKNVRFDNDGIVYFTSVKNAAGYKVTLYNQNKEEIGCRLGYGNKPLENQPDIVDDNISEYIQDVMTWAEDVTAIYVTVSAVTYDIEKYQSGDESAFSNAYQIGEIKQDISTSLGSTLDKVASGDIRAEEALDDFLGYMEENDKSNFDLAVSMLTDENIEQNIDTLEEKFIEQTGVEVEIKSTAQDESYLSDRGIDVNDITVKGAALNSDNGANVSLNFSEADPDISADEKFYKNSVAVNIGMDGVTNAQKLDIPVIIEMPVPTGVVPHRLFILHYHADGSYEQIQPAIIYDDDKAYARFILTSFSDFVFCNINDDFLMGNVYLGDEIDEASGKISIKDAIALAQYLSGYNAYLTNEQLAAANVCTYDDVMGATVDVNINQNDLDLLMQYIAGNDVYLG